MEIYRPSTLWFFMGITLLLLCPAKAEKKDKSPLANVNLAPYQKWENAYLCMQNHSYMCDLKNELNMSGIVDVHQNEITDYCKAGSCREHIKYVLQCINSVMPDFKFTNGAKVALILDRVTNGCNKSEAFSTANYKSSTGTRAGTTKMSVISALSTLVLMTIFNV